MLTWELVGAVVGAGLASGREIASFFSRYGSWSAAGIIFAVLTMIVLSDARRPVSREGRWLERIWNCLLSLLLIATGGAMLSGAGSVAALLLPVREASWIGAAGTLALAWFLAHRAEHGLALVSELLLAVFAILIFLGLFTQPMDAVYLADADVPCALMRGIAYGGFNAALQAPLIARTGEGTSTQRRKAVLRAGGIIGLLLMLGNAVLLRHPALLSEEMPYIRLLQGYGQFGYILGCISLYLAILSTITACFRGLGGRILPAACMVAVSLLGFTGVVEKVYPLLGGGCFLMLLTAKLMNYSRRTFLSRRDML